MTLKQQTLLFLLLSIFAFWHYLYIPLSQYRWEVYRIFLYWDIQGAQARSAFSYLNNFWMLLSLITLLISLIKRIVPWVISGWLIIITAYILLLTFFKLYTIYPIYFVLLVLLWILCCLGAFMRKHP